MGHLIIAKTGLELKILLCGIPQAWYGAGLLSLWSKGRVGSIPTSRAISKFNLILNLFFVIKLNLLNEN